MATVDDLEARLAALEALFVEPRATVPPITVGELTDVPAPGSPIASAWAQEVSNRVVHRFATVAAMNAWAAGNGSLATVLAADATAGLYERQGGAWRRFWPYAWGFVASAQTVTANSGIIGETDIPGLIINPTLVAGRRYLIKYSLAFQSVGPAGNVLVRLVDGANISFDNAVGNIGGGAKWSAFGMVLVNGTGAAVTFKVRAGTDSAGGSVNTLAASTWPGTLQCFDVGGS